MFRGEFMAYVALYRKWRPETFKDLVGQEHISRTLSNAITSGRIGHAYLFSGPRGTGKTSTAKIFARALNCEQGPTPDPCGECEPCRKIGDGSSMDVFEIDAASNRGIDEIRDLRETVNFAPVDGRYKVYIIDEVHMLTTEAFNALLKTLEEPPAHVVFILATTEAHKVPATIQSRCQRYDFRRITAKEIEARMAHIVASMDIEAEPEALSMIALQADGGLRDALSILDQCASLAEGTVTADRVRRILGLVGHDWIYKLTAALAGKKTQEVLEILAELLREGQDLKQILVELSLHLRSLMIYQAAGSLEQLDLYEEKQEALEEQAKFFPADRLMQMIGRLHEALTELKWSPQPRITVEVALLSLCREEGNGEAAAVQAVAAPADEARLAQLEAKLAQVTAALAKGAAAAVPVAAMPAPRPARPAQPRPAASSGEPVGALTADESGVQLWHGLLQELKARNKAPVLACLQQGRFVGMNQSQFVIAFGNSLMASLTARNYRALCEEILANLAGRALRLVARGEDAPLAPPPAPRSRKEPEVQIEAPPRVEIPPEERPPALAKAMEVFGDNIVAVEEENS